MNPANQDQALQKNETKSNQRKSGITGQNLVDESTEAIRSTEVTGSGSDEGAVMPQARDAGLQVPPDGDSRNDPDGKDGTEAGVVEPLIPAMRPIELEANGQKLPECEHVGQEEVMALMAPLHGTDKEEDPDQDMCRICLEAPGDVRFMRACWCKGTMGFIHGPCLEIWIKSSAKTHCEYCLFPYNLYIKPTCTRFLRALSWFKVPFISSDVALRYRKLVVLLFVSSLLFALGFWMAPSSPVGFQKTKLINGTEYSTVEPDVFSYCTTIITVISLCVLPGVICMAFAGYVQMEHYRFWQKWCFKQHFIRVLPIQPEDEVPVKAVQVATELPVGNQNGRK